MHKPSLLSLLLLSTTLASGAAFARGDEMPPPSRAPRTPVSSEKISAQDTAGASAAGITGVAQAIDGQTVRVHDSSRDVTARLLGVVAPPLTTRDGVSARTTLDGLLRGQTIDCTKRDRDRDGSLVMSCTYGGGKDLSEALLFTGAALFSRTGVADNDLAVRYRAAEETAQMRRQGLWSQIAAQMTTAAMPATTTAASPTVAAKPATDQGPTASAAPVAAKSDTAGTNGDSGFAFATWLEAMGLLGAMFGMLLWLDHRHTKRARLDHDLDVRTDRQVLAAALTGELAAARDICEARAALVAAGGEPRWPRLRTYIYQAHAEQIGLLGAVLARQVASIYGQMADYGASNRGATGTEIDLTTPAATTRALVRLCGYIEITLEGLAEVEHTGEPYYPATANEQEAEESHASQIARTATPGALPAGTVPSSTERPKAAIRRIAAAEPDVANDISDEGPHSPTDGPSNGPSGGEPAPAPGSRVRYRNSAGRPAATTRPTAQAATDFPADTAADAGIAGTLTGSLTAKPADSESDSLPETIEKIVPAASVAAASEVAPEDTEATATDETRAGAKPTGSRAARRTALHRKARNGQLFKAEQALAETNAALDDGADDQDESADSKTA